MVQFAWDLKGWLCFGLWPAYLTTVSPVRFQVIQTVHYKLSRNSLQSLDSQGKTDAKLCKCATWNVPQPLQHFLWTVKQKLELNELPSSSFLLSLCLRRAGGIAFPQPHSQIHALNEFYWKRPVFHLSPDEDNLSHHHGGRRSQGLRSSPTSARITDIMYKKLWIKRKTLSFTHSNVKPLSLFCRTQKNVFAHVMKVSGVQKGLYNQYVRVHEIMWSHFILCSY